MAWDGSHSRGFPTKTRARILKRDPVCRCPGCRHHTGPCTQPSTDADHILNLARGGTNHIENGQGLCHPCHLIKTAHEAHAHRPKTRRDPEPHPGGHPTP